MATGSETIGTCLVCGVCWDDYTNEARCRKCDRQVVLSETKAEWEKLCQSYGLDPNKFKTKVKHDKDVLMGDLCDVAWTGSELNATEMFIDSGCRRSVAGGVAARPAGSLGVREAIVRKRGTGAGPHRKEGSAA